MTGSSVSERDLHKLTARALEEQGVWPSLLAVALKSCDQAGRGLLLCAVNARDKPESAKLLLPVATQTRLRPLCAMAREVASSKACEAELKQSLPGHAGLAFQFVPTGLWKTVAEPAWGFKVNRRNLKAKNVLVVVAWVMLPAASQPHGNDALLELAFYEEGAVLPDAFAQKLGKEAKAELFSKGQSACGADLATIMAFAGLDHDMLREVPEYQRFHALFSEHARALFTPAELLMPLWLIENGQACHLGDSDDDVQAKAVESVVAFFGKHMDTISALQDIMGHERVTAVRRDVHQRCAQEAERMARYCASFKGRVAGPCPSCGLAAQSTYACPCMRPEMLRPAWPVQGPLHQALAQPKPGSLYTSRRRGKNIQTAFASASAASEACQPKNQAPL